MISSKISEENDRMDWVSVDATKIGQLNAGLSKRSTFVLSL